MRIFAVLAQFCAKSLLSAFTLHKMPLVEEFCCKSVNLFFEKLTNIKVILFIIHELFR